MIVLITGASGYLGSALANKLSSKVRTVYTLSRTKNNWTKLNKSNIRNIQLDMKKKKKLKKVLKKIKPDIIFHLAAYLPKNKKKNIFSTSYYNNFIITKNLLDCSYKLESIKKIIFSSSISVYEDNYNDFRKMSENFSIKPTTYYGLHKLKSEIELLKWAKKNKKLVFILRFSGIHGHPRNSGVIYNYYDAASRNQNIEVLKPNFIFSFLFLEDAVNACIACINKLLIPKQGHIFNISGNEEISLKKLSLMIKERFKFSQASLDIKENPLKKYSVLSNKKASRKLNWKPQSFELALDDSIKKWGKDKA